jgi:Lon protease-like protein
MHDLPTDGHDETAGATVLMPDVLPIFPLPRTVLLPGEVLPLHVFEPRYRDMVRDALGGHKVIGMVQLEPGHEGELAGEPPVRPIGCVGVIAQHQELPDGRFLLWLLGVERFHIDEELPVATRYRQVRVDYRPVSGGGDATAAMEPLRSELRATLPGIVQTDDETRSQLSEQLAEVGDDQLIALAAQILELPADRKQDILEAATLTDRFTMIYEDLYAHMEIHPDLDDTSPDRVH